MGLILFVSLTVLNLVVLWLHLKWFTTVKATVATCYDQINGPWKQGAKVEALRDVLNGMSEARENFKQATHGSDDAELVTRVYDDLILAVSDVYMAEADKLVIAD